MQAPTEDNAPGVADHSVYVAALKRGLDVLNMFSHDTRVVSIGEMARELDVHKSSASRIAATLASAGFLGSTGIQGQYRLGPRLRSLGALAESGSRLDETVMPYVQALTEATGETGHLAVLDGPCALTIGVTDGWHTVRMHSWVGKSSPAHLSSIGKALLASRDVSAIRTMFRDPLATPTPHSIGSVRELVDTLETVRRLGYATDIEELETGLRCVAAPIVDVSGTIVAGLSVSGPSQRLSQRALRLVALHVRWAAANASRALGAHSAPDGWPPFPSEAPEPLGWVEKARSQFRLESVGSRL